MKAIEKTWHVIFWACGLSIGAVLLFTEMSGVTAPSVLVIVGFMTIIAFSDYLIRKNEAEPVSIFTTPLPIVTGNYCTSFNPQSSGFCNADGLNLDCFTKEEEESWLKNEPNFTKRIVTRLESDFKHRRYRTIFLFLRKLESLVLER